MIRNNTPEENEFQLKIQTAFETHDATLGFATMVDVTLGWLVFNMLDHVPEITKKRLLDIVAQTYDEIKEHA